MCEGNRTQTVYDQHLQKLKGKAAKVFLTSGVGLSGRLVAFDSESILLRNEREGTETLVLRQNSLSITEDKTSAYRVLQSNR